MAKKKRKVKVGRILLLIVILLAIIAGLFVVLFSLLNKEEEKPFSIDDLHINEISYQNAKEFDFDIYSKEYLLICLNDIEVEYAKGVTNRIYPASLTKVVTMDAVLRIADSLEDVSSLSNKQKWELIEENASLAYIDTDTDYSLSDLLYALVLPSGADAATALNNYAMNKGTTLVDEMNALCSSLGLIDSHFTNTSGLHDDDLYTTLDDYTRIVIDVLLNENGKRVLKTTRYTLEDGTDVSSTLSSLKNRVDDITVYGGKTGFTYEAGMNIMVLYEVNNRSYLLLLANAEGNPYVDGMKNIEDVNNIFNHLYN